MARESKTKYTILGLLNIGDMSGYQMKRAIEKYFVYFWNESWGQIYPTLKQLTRDELVEVRCTEDSRKTKTYSITAKGRSLFQEYQLKTPDSINLRSELLLKIFLGRDTEPDVLIRHIENELYKREQIIQEQSKIVIDPSDCSNKFDEQYWKYTLKFGEMYNRMIYDWCNFVINDMKNREDDND